MRVGLKSLPQVNQQRCPEACDPELVVAQWMDAFLSHSSEMIEVDDSWGSMPRYTAELVTQHRRRCARCTDAQLCVYARLLDTWVRYGVDLHVLCTTPKPSRYARVRLVQTVHCSEAANNMLYARWYMPHGICNLVYGLEVAISLQAARG